MLASAREIRLESGSPALAAEVLALLAEAGMAATSDAARPLDHGAWVPLMHLFPCADVPVVQLALPASYGPAQLLAMGQAQRAHLSEDHFLPLFFALGAAGWGDAQASQVHADYLSREVRYGMQAMHSFALSLSTETV